MTDLIAWVQRIPLYAQAAAVAAIVAGFVRFGGDLLKFIQSWRDLKKPKQQPTLDDVKKVERVVLTPTSSHVKRDVVVGTMMGAAAVTAGALLEQSHHVGTISHAASGAADFPVEHLGTIVEMHPVAEHADSLTEIASNLFEAATSFLG